MKVVLISLYIYFFLLFYNAHTMQLGMGNFKRIKTTNKQAINVIQDISSEGEEQEVQIFFKGWVKYLHYTDKEQSQPKGFYKNVERDRQNMISLDSAIRKEKDCKNPLSSELLFYAILYKESLNIISSDQNSFTNIIDSLDLNYLKPIPDDMTCSGGIKDLHKAKEGYCFQIIVLIPLTKFTPTEDQLEPKQAIKQTWIFCHESASEKKKLMNEITKLKIKIQRKLGLFIQSPITTKISEVEMNIQEDNKVDGRWVIIQEWTECTLKCGGGMKYQQNVCIPPKFGGRQCEGDAVRTLPCNTQPCPDPSNLNTDIESMMTNIFKSGTNQNNRNTTNILLPVIRTLAISDRPLQYDKCYLKESDAFMIKEDDLTKDMVNKPRIPVRLVLNNKTFSAYLTDNISYMVVTFLLNESVLKRSKTYEGCFEIVSPVKSSVFCQLDHKDEWLEEWDYDFNLFKNQCKEERNKSDSYLKEQNSLEKEFKSKLKSLKEQFLIKISQKSRKASQENEVNIISKQVQNTHNYYLMALQREVELEKLLKKEELEREAKENEEFEKQIEVEKKKEDCLSKAIKEKETESQFNLSKYQADNEIKEIEEKTRIEIIAKRASLKKELEDLRKRQLRNTIKKKTEIVQIKYGFAEKMGKVSKKGDSAICRDKTKMKSYCTSNFINDLLRTADCNKEETFCEICCENEFGAWWLTERDDCFKLCKNQ